MPQASMDFTLADSSATEVLGAALARSRPGAAAEPGASAGPGVAAGPGAALDSPAEDGGAVVYFQGELGAGKTTCARSLLRALGVTGLVRSPTYTLVETYRLDALTCVHVDLYRLQSLAEVEELGLRDMVGAGCLLLVEWPDRGAAALPPADLYLTLVYAGEGRQARISAPTPLGSRWMANLGCDSRLVSYVSNLA